MRSNVGNPPGNTLTKRKIAHLQNNKDICPFWGVNLLSVSTVLSEGGWVEIFVLTDIKITILL